MYKCMHIIAGRCLSTSIVYCSRAFLFFPSFTLSPFSLSSLFLSFSSYLSPLLFLSASLPLFLFFLPFSFLPLHSFQPLNFLLFPNSSPSFLLIPPFLGRLLPVQALISFLFLHQSNHFFFLPLHSFIPLHSFLSLLSILPLHSVIRTSPSPPYLPTILFIPINPSHHTPLFLPIPPSLPLLIFFISLL